LFHKLEFIILNIYSREQVIKHSKNIKIYSQ
jgi:hypothetical protein